MVRILRFSLIMRSLLAAIVLLIGCTPGYTAGTRRVALLIANTTYTNTTPLPNPDRDVKLIASRLSELGFEVTLESDLDAKKMSAAMMRFAQGLDKNTDALFYYAGHGLQLLGENYLVGVDAELKSEALLQFETFKLNSVLSIIEARAGTSLIFWDACRSNPLATELVNSLSARAPPAGQGRAREGAAPLPPRRGDTLVVFSAEPGKLAMDGAPGNYSPFAHALAQHMTAANVEIEVMLKRVTADVLKATRDYQRPERLSQLTREFYFRREGQAKLIEEQELSKLRERLSQLEQQSHQKRRFTIQTVKDGRIRTPRVSPPAAQLTPITQTVRGEGSVAQGGPEPDVIVAVNATNAAVLRKLRVSPNGKLIAAGGDDGIIRVINMDTFEVVKTIRGHASRVSDLDFSPDSGKLISAGRDGVVRFWNIESGALQKELEIDGSVPYSARLNPGFPERFILMGDRSGRLTAWNMKQHDKLITNRKFHNGPVTSVAYQPRQAGAYLSAGGDGFLKVRFPSGKRVSLHAHNGAIFQAGYTGSGNLVYSVGMDRKIKLWKPSLASTAPAVVLEGHLKYVLAADISANEQLLVSGGGDKALNLWAIPSGKLVGRMRGHTGDVESVAFTPDGRFVISCSEDKSLRIWSVENQEELARMIFTKGDTKYVGVTFENQSFGDRDSGLISVYVDGRQLQDSEADRVVPYIGRGISIVEGGG